MDLKPASKSSQKKKNFNLCLWFRGFCTLLWFFAETSKAKQAQIPIGVVVDLKSSIGSMAVRCIQMAHDDFYKQYSHYQTRLELRISDSKNDAVTAASAALDLIKNENVHAIIGPLSSEQASFVIRLGHKFQVPIVSFSATSPSLPPLRSKFFIRTAQDDRSQVQAIAAIVEAYGWHEIIPIYEDTEFGKGLIPYLTETLEEVNTRVPYRIAIDPNSEEYEILEELKKLNQSRKGICLVHMTSLVGPKFFSAVNKAGMMTEGYGWIVTDGLSNVLAPLGPKVMDSMQGIVGVRPRLEKSRGLTIFRDRWKAWSIKSGSVSSPLTLFGLWAYDTVWR
ncbi:glutamate receptor 2.1-like [Neltuma alba]|uniref:glutamate receptor 2.1-like n=1 Tax=Neltuma alba TaxID=207710 RepID=UPI0010A430E9|nr:glutamate receptor 2.1-like [Prosopis alba]